MNETKANYTVVIGLEVHVQLLTRTKAFCGCVNLFNPDNPNVQTCPVCLGLPGALPVMNRKAFRLALRTATALNCQIARFTKWDRKQYYYPDLPKNYQISQYDLPFSHDGWLEIETDDGQDKRRVGIIRVHLEEDAGKNLHDETKRGRDSLVDLNRAGTPLLEIVTKPDIRSPGEARRFLEELRLLLRYLEVSDCNMQEGSLRCDANVNLHIHLPNGETVATPIVEVKNMNSFRAVEAALTYEVKRQYKQFQETGKRLGEVPKETRGWDEKREITFSQRGKEEASDYRYFPDPDLVPVTVSEELLEEVRAELCELPAARRERLQKEYELSRYDASVVIDQGRAFADYFEQVAKECGDYKRAANWVTQEVLRELNQRRIEIDAFPIRPSELAYLLKKIGANELTTKGAREVFAELLQEAEQQERKPTTARIDQIIEQRGLAIVSDAGALESVVEAVIAANQKAAEDFRNGKQAAVGRLIGEVMRQVKGADPKLVRQMLIEKLSR